MNNIIQAIEEVIMNLRQDLKYQQEDHDKLLVAITMKKNALKKLENELQELKKQQSEREEKTDQ